MVVREVGKVAALLLSRPEQLSVFTGATLSRCGRVGRGLIETRAVTPRVVPVGPQRKSRERADDPTVRGRAEMRSATTLTTPSAHSKRPRTRRAGAERAAWR